ncbi:hypothetical protein CTA1_11613 [Colletotrichum tanaceti]|uniref:Nitrogen assimilation transcription factor nit-4 n=1 Tax=Colletotrichum tanaceti TaxID=1306861 RepID=A0A4U6XSW0_9PEZI|nr:hypothetical protein CTA1_11613 [Colletotrichum tanaceti]
MACHTCKTSNSPCVYPVPEGLSQRQAQKQKLNYVSRAHENSQRVLELLRASRDGASQDILKQLQHSEDLDEAIQSIADASLLLPKFHEQRRGNSEPDHALPVSHWTIVSRDNKLMTHLLDMFWMWDSTLSHLVDRELFAADLSATLPGLSTGQPRSFCSPFLVNAILAVASLHATRKTFEPYSGDFVVLSHDFARCAFELLESERRSGSSSLTLLQGAAILWLFAKNEGARASPTQAASLGSLIQRTWSELGLDAGGPMASRASGTIEAQNVKIWKAVSHMTWGFYCFFAKMAALCSPEMLVPRPRIMKAFEDVEAQQGLSSQASFLSTSDESPDSQTSHQLQVFSAKCSLCEISNQFTSGFSMKEQASFLDSSQCTALYNKLLCWKLSLPNHLITSNSVSPSVATYDFVALRLLYSYTSHAGTDLFDGRNAASLQVLHASSMMTNLWIYRNIYTIKHEYWAAEYCSSVAHALLPSLEANASTPVVHDIVGRACCVLNDMACAGVSGRAGELLEGIEERARAAKIRVPAYGGQEAEEEARGGAPMIMLRGVRVFDGAEGADGRHNPPRLPDCQSYVGLSRAATNGSISSPRIHILLIFRVAVMSLSGFPSTSTRSARRPPRTMPRSLSRKAVAATQVAERSTWITGMPASTRDAGPQDRVRRRAGADGDAGLVKRAHALRRVVIATAGNDVGAGALDRAIVGRGLVEALGGFGTGVVCGWVVGRRTPSHHGERRHEYYVLGGHLARQGGVDGHVQGRVGEDVEAGAQGALVGRLAGGAGDDELAVGVGGVDEGLENIVVERFRVDRDLDEVGAVRAAGSRRDIGHGVLARADDVAVRAVVQLRLVASGGRWFGAAGEKARDSRSAGGIDAHGLTLLGGAAHVEDGRDAQARIHAKGCVSTFDIGIYVDETRYECTASSINDKVGSLSVGIVRHVVLNVAGGSRKDNIARFENGFAIEHVDILDQYFNHCPPLFLLRNVLVAFA